MQDHALTSLARARAARQPLGITSVCSAHKLVVEAALLQAATSGGITLIEATCNQVNQHGGYTGLRPADFRDQVFALAARIGLPRERIILGGDHLGPNPWKRLPAEQALAQAETMVAAYVQAGFSKLHLDTSMGCAGEPAALPDAITAARAARLAAVAEAIAASTGLEPAYVIGTEVPTPGGATESLDHLAITEPHAVQTTYLAHQEAFAAAGVASAMARVIALVVQPGVEFGHTDVSIYAPEKARALGASLTALPGLVFEAHSTDYQPQKSLAALVRDGFAILKVGPALTFALREALYALDHIREVLDFDPNRESLPATMERVMLADPSHWQGHYHGSPDELRVLRHFSYSDRIRYHWPAPEAAAAVTRLLNSFGETPIPRTLISQYCPHLLPLVASGAVAPKARPLLLAAIRQVLHIYEAACRPSA